MNFLAHSFFSPNNSICRLSNMTADAFKGSIWEELNPEVIKGIKLHRKLDDFIDHNENANNVKKLFSKELGRYSGIAVDMFFDFYLSSKINQAQPMLNYLNNLEVDFKFAKEFLTPKQQQLALLIFDRKWMMDYGNYDGLTNILNQMSARVKNKVEFALAIPIVKKNEVDIFLEFDELLKQSQKTFESKFFLS